MTTAGSAGGAAAVSVLTEPTEFFGSLEHLQAAAERLRPRGCPVMRKDFLVDSYQVLEARANGASGVLLIAAMLSDAKLEEMLAAAAELDLFVLLEAFDTDDLERLTQLAFPSAPQVLIGINSRDLKTLAVDFGRFGQLASLIRPDVPAVAESGIETVADLKARAGDLRIASEYTSSTIIRLYIGGALANGTIRLYYRGMVPLEGVRVRHRSQGAARRSAACPFRSSGCRGW